MASRVNCECVPTGLLGLQDCHCACKAVVLLCTLGVCF
jgi:hypothetical protein